MRWWTTFVLTREGSGVWRLAAIRNMAPTDPARSSGRLSARTWLPATRKRRV